ncbi:MAG TPA: glycoside hydrolase family 43 C-terminal domain-containing protein, partial [Candidatus Goldiibacteriota bacterium]|nr:glycoside hydrolase family 43 C-terminal domain-containing protein [Candidatus Goldiibacteriota bacterium]
AADGGYNIRVARSSNPNGPYYDALGQNMINAKGRSGTLFDDNAIQPYGVKLIGNYRFMNNPNFGYVSPGHNSAYYDSVSGKFFIIFHTRFSGTGEYHEVRTHQLFFNSDEWPVIAPFQYAGETLTSVTVNDMTGVWRFIDHGKDITPTVKNDVAINLNGDGTITGGINGTWSLNGNYYINLIIGGVTYKGVVILNQWDASSSSYVHGFSAVSQQGISVWGAKHPVQPTATRTQTMTRTATGTSTRTNTVQPTGTFTGTRTQTPTYSRTATATTSSTFNVPSSTFTTTNTATATRTNTVQPTNTFTGTRTVTPTWTRTSTRTNTVQPTNTFTGTRTSTPSLTVTDTISSNTPTITPTYSRTATLTQTATNSQQPTSTFTWTRTMTPTWTETITSTFAQTATRTFTQTNTPSFTLTITQTRTY